MKAGQFKQKELSTTASSKQIIAKPEISISRCTSDSSNDCKVKFSESNSELAKTTYTANKSKTQELFADRIDFLSSESSIEGTIKKQSNQTSDNQRTSKKIYQRRTTGNLNTYNLETTELQEVQGMELNDDSNVSVDLENEYSKTYTLQYVFKNKKLRNRVLDFLAPTDMVSLKSTNKFFHLALSVETRVFNSVLQHHHAQFEIKIASLEKKLSLFEGNTANITGDYVQF